jgi:hypothetical protein
MADFFISYNKADCPWAEWIAWQLEEAGSSTLIQVWDFRPGGNFVLEMQAASAGSKRTIAVLSPDYLAAHFTYPEWAAAFSGDPQGADRKLIPVRVRDCAMKGLLSQIIYIDLIGLDEARAKVELLRGVTSSRAKPPRPPAFPASAKPTFPGTGHTPSSTKTNSPPPAPEMHAGSLLALFQSVYEFAMAKMYKTRHDAEVFANLWVQDYADVDFTRFQEAYDYALSRMYKTRDEAEVFALSTIKSVP